VAERGDHKQNDRISIAADREQDRRREASEVLTQDQTVRWPIEEVGLLDGVAETKPGGDRVDDLETEAALAGRHLADKPRRL
jgi:hypothetical protein